MSTGSNDNRIVIYGRNAVSEAIKSADRSSEVYYRESPERALRAIVEEAEKKKIRCAAVSQDELSKRAGSGDHQGIAMALPPFRFSTVDEMLNDAREKGEAPFLVLLDSIQDPRNLGAIVRTAHQAGARRGRGG